MEQYFPARLATLPYGLHSNVTELLANLLPKLSVFYYLSIVSCNLVSIKLLLLYYYGVKVSLSSKGMTVEPGRQSSGWPCCVCR